MTISEFRNLKELVNNYILGVRINDLPKEEVLQKIEGFLSDGKQHYVVLPYAEFLVKAKEDFEFKEILNRADLCLAEGFGVIFGSRILGQPIKNRIMGVDLVKAITDRFGQKRKIFFFGAKEGAAKKAAENLGRELNIETLGGFIDDSRAIQKINLSGAEILFVGLGMPKQERWIARNLPQLPRVKIAIGIGGAFDFISGRVERAPKWMQKAGFEWLWRLIIQPWRIRRIYRSVAVFLWLIIGEKISRRLKK
ncbi:MAG: Glycosyl transferase, WecB/TagA/CpsF family [Parcubacteria group bacterium GW2011_GWC1_43_12]|nr:MAG: Glycosyl transferase, WecB/TagA/CpsF family [Parcubacteria group bacterium GW2011_GWC1_43_12]